MKQFKQTQSNHNEDNKFDPTIAAGKGNIALILISVLGAFFLLTALLIGLDSLGILPLDKFRLGNSNQSPSASVNFTKPDGQASPDQPITAKGLTFPQPAKFVQSVDIAGDLTAPNILYSLIAGKGISISAGQTPTVTNSGVLSFGGASGDIKTSTGLAMDANQTLTVANVPNSALGHSKVNVSAGSNLTGGGDVNLGDSTTLALTDSITLSTATFSGTLGVGGEASISSKLIFNYLGNLGNLAWSPTGPQTVTVPDATGTICLTTGNCSGIGGVVGGSGSQNYVAKWNAGGTTLGNSIIYDNGSNVSIGSTIPSKKLDVAGDVNINAGSAFYINGGSVLNATTLGAGVTASSLTGVGALTSGSIAAGFGTISTANNITGTTINGTNGVNTGAGAGTARIDASGNLTNIGTITSGLINSQTIGSAANFTGTLNVATGYQIGGAAAGGNYLRGNGTNFVASTIQPGDLPAGSGNYIQNQTSLQSSSNFHVSGTGIADTAMLVGYSTVTGGVAAFNGNVGIGTTGPSVKLQVNGGIWGGGFSDTAALGSGINTTLGYKVTLGGNYYSNSLFISDDAATNPTYGSLYLDANSNLVVEAIKRGVANQYLRQVRVKREAH